MFRLMEHDLGGPGQLFETRGQWLNLDTADTGLCVGDAGEVILERTQDRTGLAHAAGQVSESMLEFGASLALFRVLVNLEVGEYSAPDAGAIAQFLDEVSGRI